MKIPDEWLANIPEKVGPRIRAALQGLELAYSGICPHCGSQHLG